MSPFRSDSFSSSGWESEDAAFEVPLPMGISSPSAPTDALESRPINEGDVGQVCEAKSLYQGKSKCKCCVNWVYECPENAKRARKGPVDTKKYAILVRHKRPHKGGTHLSLHSIVIQSPLLKELLCRVFQGYRGVTADLGDVVFKPPFIPFFHRWRELGEAIEQTKDAEAAGHASLLHDVLTPEMAETIQKHEDLVSHGEITFDYVWTLFTPGQILYTMVNDQERILKLCSSEYSHSGLSNTYSLRCKFIDYNGTRLGYASHNVQIYEFEGKKSFAELEILPASFHHDFAGLTERLYQRGKLFLEYRIVQHKGYRDTVTFKPSTDSLTSRPKGGLPYPGAGMPITVAIDNRVIIDGASYYTHNPTSMAYLDSLDIELFTPSLDFASSEKHRTPVKPEKGLPPPAMSMCGGPSILPPPGLCIPPPPPPGLCIPPPPPPGNHEFSSKLNEGSNQLLTHEQTLLCSPMVRGFCLKNKKWTQLAITNIKDIEWNDSAFASLVLPTDYKQLVQTFVESQMKHGLQFDDFVEGKGRGLVMLLSGEPGVGKTLTAESLAEHLKAPLYTMSAAELGETTNQVEATLERTLNLATKWNAILLLDECDVFLEQRRDSDLVRNKIVSIFLRTLEYYQGILILTTNRISAFDRAFKSRIHITLHYPRLDSSAREQVWRNFHQQLKYDSKLTDAGFKRLAEEEMNGREIKNAMKAAQLLASSRREPMALEHVQSVLRATMGKGVH